MTDAEFEAQFKAPGILGSLRDYIGDKAVGLIPGFMGGASSIPTVVPTPDQMARIAYWLERKGGATSFSDEVKKALENPGNRADFENRQKEQGLLFR